MLSILYIVIYSIIIRAPLIVQLVKNLPAMQGPQFNFWVGKICWRRDRLPTSVFLGFPCGSAGKEPWSLRCQDLGSILGLGRPPGEGKGYPLKYSVLENSMDCIVQGVAKSQIHWAAFTFSVCVSILISQSLPLPLTSWYPYSCSLHLCLYFCFWYKIIYAIT